MSATELGHCGRARPAADGASRIWQRYAQLWTDNLPLGTAGTFLPDVYQANVLHRVLRAGDAYAAQAHQQERILFAYGRFLLEQFQK
jgi:hypothetical protein